MRPRLGIFSSLAAIVLSFPLLSADVGKGTNHVMTTNWVPAPSNYRMLGGKVSNSQDLRWQNVSFDPTHVWNPSFRSFSKIGEPYSRKYVVELRAQTNRPPGLPEHLKLFTVSSRYYSPPPSVSITVSNVPLSSQDLFDGGAAGLARRLNVRAYPLTNITNISGFKVTRIARIYDHGLPYFGKLPIVSKRPVATTNKVTIEPDSNQVP